MANLWNQPDARSAGSQFLEMIGDAMVARIVIPLVGLLCLFPFIGSATALVLGVAIALSIGNPYPTKKFVSPLLGYAVAGLGAGMNLETVARVGFQGLGTTFISIAAVCGFGYLLMRLLRVENEVGTLITVGTAICGGSAIAAITPVIRAKHQSVSVALGTVFILNALALVIFPPIGRWFGLSQESFGLWAALAIHDTSSVVGASVAYGPIAATIGTTVKLARALWIVPLTLVLGWFYRKSADAKAEPAKKPWFILWFLIAAALVTWIPALQPVGHVVELCAKRLLVVILFMIGLGLSRETLRTVGLRPLLMGVVLWVVTGAVTLALIHAGVLR